MINALLTNTLYHLKGINGLTDRRVAAVYLTRYFTVVSLDNGSIGACMNYSIASDDTLAAAETVTRCVVQTDPFTVHDVGMMNKAFESCVPDAVQRYLLITSITASIASALSSSSIEQGGDKDFVVQSKCPSEWFNDIESALVIGFGGYFRRLAMDVRVKHLHVSDLSYTRRRSDFDAELSQIKEDYPNKKISVSCGVDLPSGCADFDLITITGSTLCNGTLESILDAASPDTRILLNGQSAGLHPRVLFDAGVSGISTTVKPKIIERTAASRDYSGETLRPLFQGLLPWIHLVRRDNAS